MKCFNEFIFFVLLLFEKLICYEKNIKYENCSFNVMFMFNFSVMCMGDLFCIWFCVNNN